VELQITWKRAIRLSVSFYFRLMLVYWIGYALFFTVGLFTSMIVSALHLPEWVNYLFVVPFSLALAAVACVVPIKAILGETFGDFRVVLVKGEKAANPSEGTDSHVPAAPDGGSPSSPVDGIV
jgi:hypothetical protein